MKNNNAALERVLVRKSRLQWQSQILIAKVQRKRTVGTIGICHVLHGTSNPISKQAGPRKVLEAFAATLQVQNIGASGVIRRKVIHPSPGRKWS